MGIEQVVDVTITRQTQVASRVGFGTAAFMVKASSLTAPTAYGSLDEVSAAAETSGALENTTAVAFATAYFGQQNRPTKLTFIPWDSEADFDTQINAAVDLNNDWYALTIDSNLDIDLNKAITWVQGNANNNPKLFFGVSGDTNILDGSAVSDIAYTSNFALQDRAVIMYRATPDYAHAAWLGLCLPLEAGSIEWGSKTLTNVAPDIFDSASISAAFAKKANIYQRIAGINLTNQGSTAGEWIDIMRGIDWLTARLAENLFTYMVQQPKIPYTDASVTALKGNITSTLQSAVDRFILTELPLVESTPVALVDVADKAARRYGPFKFTGTLAGAIKSVTIRGTVTY